MGKDMGATKAAARSQFVPEPARPRGGKTRYGFDFRHSAVISFLYELPTIPGIQEQLGEHFFGGWQMNGIVVLRSGPAVHDHAGQHDQHHRGARPPGSPEQWRARQSDG